VEMHTKRPLLPAGGSVHYTSRPGQVSVRSDTILDVYKCVKWCTICGPVSQPLITRLSDVSAQQNCYRKRFVARTHDDNAYLLTGFLRSRSRIGVKVDMKSVKVIS